MTVDRKFKRHEKAAIAKVKEFIDQHPVNDKTTPELAKMVNINRNVLVKGFKKLHGSGIQEYRVRLRLEYAKLLLAEGKPVKWVAAKCLYASQSTFCIAFKREFHITATEWLKT